MRRYVDARRAAGAAGQTIKNKIGALRLMLRLGYKNQKVGRLPPFPEIQADNVRKNFFEDNEFERLITALREVIAEGRDLGNDWLVPFVIVPHWIGTRRDELLALERRQLELDNGRLTLDPGTTKNGDGRVVYLPSAALEALRAWDEHTQALDRDRGVMDRRTSLYRELGERAERIVDGAGGPDAIGPNRLALAPHAAQIERLFLVRWRGRRRHDARPARAGEGGSVRVDYCVRRSSIAREGSCAALRSREFWCESDKSRCAGRVGEHRPDPRPARAPRRDRARPDLRRRDARLRRRPPLPNENHRKRLHR